ncbi:hypothetical protein [Pimelobacter simplex]|uniref:hypothetical protein n=1 Tax=Nocardioides simplex TaxID=2045 RepID=UPI0019333DDF|nr:hypothetical protein [Pimelobacter simplex]
MVVWDWIVLVLRRRRERQRLAASRVARERAVVHREEMPVVPSRGDLICFNAAIHPC